MINLEEYERKYREDMADQEAMFQVRLKVWMEEYAKNHPVLPMKPVKRRTSGEKFIDGLIAFLSYVGRK